MYVLQDISIFQFGQALLNVLKNVQMDTGQIQQLQSAKLVTIIVLFALVQPNLNVRDARIMEEQMYFIYMAQHVTLEQNALNIIMQIELLQHVEIANPLVLNVLL